MKVTLNGEVFDFDGRKQKVAEALAIEEAYGRRYVEWQDDMTAGGAKALCTLAWLIWRRDGRDVALEDILTDKVELDLNELLSSIIESAQADAAAEAEAEKSAAANPTPAGSDPAGTPTTGPSTSPSSATTSGSARGKSGSSKSRTSRP